MNENKMFYYLIAFILGYLVARHMGNGFSVSGITFEEAEREWEAGISKVRGIKQIDDDCVDKPEYSDLCAKHAVGSTSSCNDSGLIGDQVRTYCKKSCKTGTCNLYCVDGKCEGVVDDCFDNNEALKEYITPIFKTSELVKAKINCSEIANKKYCAEDGGESIFQEEGGISMDQASEINKAVRTYCKKTCNMATTCNKNCTDGNPDNPGICQVPKCGQSYQIKGSDFSYPGVKGTCEGVVDAKGTTRTANDTCCPANPIETLPNWGTYTHSNLDDYGFGGFSCCKSGCGNANNGCFTDDDDEHPIADEFADYIDQDLGTPDYEFTIQEWDQYGDQTLGAIADKIGT